MADPYRELGQGCAGVRRPDPRIACRVREALGDAASVVNVGAGAGSYEPLDRPVLAVEPSATMLRQRPSESAPAVRAVAEHLPCADDQFDAALAVLMVHHWRDPLAGLTELRRVSRRQVVVTWVPEVMARYWLTAEYLPEIAELERGLACLDLVVEGLAGPGRRVETRVVDVPWNCADGFLAAYWRRPRGYLDAAVRAGMSGVARLPETVVGPAIARLADDLRTGRWHGRHRDLLDRDALDVGYRLVVASGDRRPAPAR